MEIRAVPAWKNQRQHNFGCGKISCREKVLLIPVAGTACDLLTWHSRKAWFLSEFTTLVKDMASAAANVTIKSHKNIMNPWNKKALNKKARKAKLSVFILGWSTLSHLHLTEATCIQLIPLSLLRPGTPKCLFCPVSTGTDYLGITDKITTSKFFKINLLKGRRRIIWICGRGQYLIKEIQQG